MIRSLFIFFALFLLQQAPAQDGLPIGQWRDHLPYQNAISIAETPDKFYCATEAALFSLDKSQNDLERITPVQNLSDVGVSSLIYNKATEKLFVAYKNGNLDIINSDNEITNLSSIKESRIIGNKSINNLYSKGSSVYLSCGFGIVVVDAEKEEIKDSYIYGTNGSYMFTNDLVINDTAIIAASNEGLYYVLHDSPNLSDFNYWNKINSLPDADYSLIEYFKNDLILNKYHSDYSGDTLMKYDENGWSLVSNQLQFDNLSIEVSGDSVIITHNGSVNILDTAYNVIENIYTYEGESVPQPRHAIVGNDNLLWVADHEKGLVKVLNNWNVTYNYPNGPENPGAYHMWSLDEEIWTVPGGLDGIYLNQYNSASVNHYSSQKWSTYDEKVFPSIDTVYDAVVVRPDPSDPETIYVGTMGLGMLKLKPEKNELTYINDKNSSLEPRSEYYWVGVGGIDFDEDNRLWASNSYTPNCLSVRKNNKEWTSFNISEYVSNTTYVGQLLIDSQNKKWIALSRKNEIVVYDDKRTLDDISDDQKVLLTGTQSQGNIPGDKLLCMAEDLEGEIWIGTNEGVAVFRNASSVFDEDNRDAERIYITQDGNVQVLLETEAVTSIAVDGADRKWFGTQSSGVYLMSADGTEQIHHFNESNSPLLSNNISSIAINNNTGEVFFGTAKGIISYKGTATEGKPTFNNVLVYPNPVKSDYNGVVAIKGLLYDTDVRITDVQGNTVYSTTALGGQAIWDVRDQYGERVKTGVYLVYCSDQQGKNRHIAKIMVIN